jgi:ribosomal protein S8E
VFCAGCTRKTRIIDVVYNASNNELVRTKTLVKNAIVTIDATPFRQWYEAHYALPLGRKKGAKLVSMCLSLVTVVGWGVPCPSIVNQLTGLIKVCGGHLSLMF